MFRRKYSKSLLISVLTLAILASADPAYAWQEKSHGHHQSRHDGYPPQGEIVLSLPWGVLSVFVGGHRYYYWEGVYYRHEGRRYAVVAPPVGAVVKRVPDFYQPVMIDGVTYYVSKGIYYKRTRQGYRVVQAPKVTVVTRPAVPDTGKVLISSASKSTNDIFTVNIPDRKGGYTSVTLKRSGNGFIGPQGEFYPEFPKVEQLKAMYGQ